MTRVTAALATWARRTRTSFGPLVWLASRPAAGAEEEADDGLVYRLRHWPELPSAARTADVLRLLSVMSHRPVNRRWMIAHSRLEVTRIDTLLQRLVARGDVEVIDVSRYPSQA